MIGAMSTEVPLKCSCGSVQGVARDVSPKTGNRLVCMCDDCQAYAHHLGRAEHILDRNGGTEVFQLTPSQLTLTEGREHLRCLRLKEKGLMRWYAGCCNTPVANTLASPGMDRWIDFPKALPYYRPYYLYQEGQGGLKGRALAWLKHHNTDEWPAVAWQLRHPVKMNLVAEWTAAQEALFYDFEVLLDVFLDWVALAAFQSSDEFLAGAVPIAFFNRLERFLVAVGDRLT